MQSTHLLHRESCITVTIRPDGSDPDEDARLLAKAGAGDRDSFRMFYERYSTPLFSLAVRMVHDKGEAEDLMQDAFLKIWKHASSYDPIKSRPFTWSVNIVRRTCIDHLRKRRTRPATTPLNDEAVAVQDFLGAGSARRATDAREDSARLAAALGGASKNQRLALELALFSEKTHAEIALLLEQPVGTVKTWIRRGLLELRETLKDSET